MGPVYKRRATTEMDALHYFRAGLLLLRRPNLSLLPRPPPRDAVRTCRDPGARGGVNSSHPPKSKRANSSIMARFVLFLTHWKGVFFQDPTAFERED
jgi:hypothetical protein